MRTITVAVFMAFISTAVAQDVKYDSAIISYYLTLHKIYVSVNGKEYTQDTVELPSEENAESLNPFINKVQQFEKKGWLCIDIKSILAPTGSKAYLAYLRRKKE